MNEYPLVALQRSVRRRQWLVVLAVEVLVRNSCVLSRRLEPVRQPLVACAAQLALRVWAFAAARVALLLFLKDQILFPLIS